MRKASTCDASRDQSGGEIGQLRRVALRKAIVDLDVLTRDVACVPETVLECRTQMSQPASARPVGPVARRDAADHWRTRTLCPLGLGAKRYGERTSQRGQQEAATVHHSMS